MMKILITNIRFLNGKRGFLVIDGAYIVRRGYGRYRRTTDHFDQIIDGRGLWVAPGFIDIQTNGHKGIDFNGATAGEIVWAIADLFRHGVTYLLPTVITGSPNAMLKAIYAITEAMRYPVVGRAILGIHAEGPFISPLDGPRGAHKKKYCRTIDIEEYQEWQYVSGGNVKIVTFDPRRRGAISFTKRLVSDGVVAALGHQNSNGRHVDRAVRAGATLGTHVWNADFHCFDRRNPEHIGRILANDALFASFIVDGIHIHPDVVKMSVRAKGLAKSILITDAMAAAGMPDGIYHLGDLEIEVRDGIARLSNGRLAGSTLTLEVAVENAMRYADLPLHQAIRLVTSNPARLLKLKRIGMLTQGAYASLVLFDFRQRRIKVKLTMLEGQVVFDEL
jgi:N-acetylglucosamine-6-phosphate deacetylase